MGTPWSPPDRLNPFASAQIGEQETFISELLNELTMTIQDLETHQIHMFYEAVGLMIGADTSRDKQEHYLVSTAQHSTVQHSTAQRSAFSCLPVKNTVFHSLPVS